MMKTKKRATSDVISMAVINSASGADSSTEAIKILNARKLCVRSIHAHRHRAGGGLTGVGLGPNREGGYGSKPSPVTLTGSPQKFQKF